MNFRGIEFQLLTHGNLNIVVVLVTVMVGCLILFCFCYFGKLATDSFTNMANRLFECNWIEFPVDAQKFILLMIRNAQKPIYYHGSGIAVLNLETFSKVLVFYSKLAEGEPAIFFFHSR